MTTTTTPATTTTNRLPEFSTDDGDVWHTRVINSRANVDLYAFVALMDAAGDAAERWLDTHLNGCRCPFCTHCEQTERPIIVQDIQRCLSTIAHLSEHLGASITCNTVAPSSVTHTVRIRTTRQEK